MLANSGQLWFYHAPLKRSNKPQQLVPPASQVPGLAALDPLDEEAWKREIGIRSQKEVKESDSKYIRLAKQGGRKNLLTFADLNGISDKPQPYPRADWFDHQDCDPEKDEKILARTTWQPPEYMVHEYETEATENATEVNIEQKRKRVPFYTDNKSVWERAQDESNDERPRRRRNKLNKLPKITQRPQKSDGVTFSKLIGGGYGTDWRQNQAGRGPAKTNLMQMGPSKGHLNITEYQDNICKKVAPPKKLKPIAINQVQRKQLETKKESPQLFKLTKFNKVPSKLNTSSAAKVCS